MLIDKLYIQRSSLAILLISFLYALWIGSGFYGFGNDYYAAYYKQNLEWGQAFDRLGWIVSTLSINNKHIGIHVTTFILSFSAGSLVREYLRLKNVYSLGFFIILYIILIHTWPIIMSTSNAMRQGLCMSFIFLALIASSRTNYLWLIIFTFVAALMHKSGPLFSLIVLFSTVISNLLMSFSYKRRLAIHFIIGTLLLALSYFFISFYFDIDRPSKIIRRDFRGAFVLISCTYVMLSFFYRGIISSPFNLSLYYFSFISPAVLMNGLNFEYERLGMVVLIPYILSFGVLLDRFYYKIYLTITFLALLLLTIYLGMYASLH